jgi:hypothetical protein
MNGQDDKIDSLFQEKLFNYSPAPPEAAWKRIELVLRQEKKRKLIPAYIRIAAAIVLFAGLGGLVWKLTYNETTQPVANKIFTENTVPMSSKDNISSKKNITESTDNHIKTSSFKNKKAIKQKPESVRNPLLKETTDVEQTNQIADEIRPEINDTVQNQNASAQATIGDSTLANLKFAAPDSLSQNHQIPPPVNNIQPNITNDLLAEDVPKNTRALKWYIGGQAGPQYSYRDVNADKATSDHYNKIESPIMAYAGGLNIQLEAARRWTVQTGVYYSKIGTERSLDNAQGTKVDKQANSWGDETYYITGRGNSPDVFINSEGVITYTYKKYNIAEANSIRETDVPYQGDYHAKQYCEYLEIPLILRYRVLANKLKVNLVGGISSNILIGSSVHETGPNNMDLNSSVENVNKTNYNGSLGFGIEYPLSGKILFNLEPIFKYYFSPISETKDVDVHPYSVGLMTGISYKF